MPPLGVTATVDRDEIVALDADCVVYSPVLAEPGDVTRLLTSGKNVVTPVGWWYPGATGRAAVRKEPDGTLRVMAIADKGAGRFDMAGNQAAVTPIGRMAFPGSILADFEEVGRGLGAGVELDDVPVLQRLAGREALAGVINSAKFFDVGVPEGYREAVAAFPARV